MSGLTLAQAAKRVGKSKSQLTRMIHSGKLSAKRLEGNIFEIDPAELARVYPPEPSRSAPERTEGSDSTRQAEALLAQVAELRHRLEDVTDERNRWRAVAERLALAPPAPIILASAAPADPEPPPVQAEPDAAASAAAKSKPSIWQRLGFSRAKQEQAS